MTSFSHHARRALSHADSLAARYQHPGADTGHLLVGMMLTVGSVAYDVLTALDLTAARAEPLLERYVPPAGLSWEDAADACKAALDATFQLAEDESTWLDHHYIGTEHLLLGLTRTNVGNASALLQLLDVTPETVRRRVRHAIQAGLSESSPQRVQRDARLSELSRRVINAAGQLAVSLDHPTVGVGHLLVVLYQEKRSLTSKLLRESGLDETALKQGLDSQEASWLMSIDGVVEQASEAARQLGDHYTGTDHLLLILTLDRAGETLLRQCGLSPAKLRARLEAALNDKR